MACLDESAVVDFVDGRLDAPAGRRLQEHIDTCSACRQLIAQAADLLLDATPLAHSVPLHVGADQLLRGALLGRYTVLERVGAGGMGAVYAAYDPELDRKVAIKLLRTDLLARGGAVELRARLLREAQAMARLVHPDVITVYDVGTLGDEVFIAMEFVDGMTLGRWARLRPRSWRQVLAAYLRAGDGLAAAHAAGLVHRDFKPDNVLIGADGRVRVTDFGLARILAAPPDGAGPASPPAGPRAGSVTSDGLPVGTPAYMAPEQRRGGDVDARADQYSFCVALREAVPAAPAWVRARLQRGLEVDPARRYPSMQALLEALRRDPGRARRRWLGLVGVAALAGIALLGLVRGSARSAPLCRGAEARLAGAWDADVGRRIRTAFARTGRPYADETYARVAARLDDYAAAWAAMRQDACEATWLRGEQSEELLDRRIDCLDRRRAALAAFTELCSGPPDPELVDRAAAVAGELPAVADCAGGETLGAAIPLPEDPAARAAVAALFGQIDRTWALYRVGRRREALAPALGLVDAARRIGHRPLEAAALLLLAEVSAGVGDGGAAEKALHEALGAAAESRDDLRLAEVLIALVRVLGVDGDRLDEALAFGRVADGLLTRARGDDAARAGLYSLLAEVKRKQGKPAEAQDYFERATALLQRPGGRDAPRAAASLLAWAAVIDAQGRYPQSRALYEQALALRERAFGADHPAVGEGLLALGTSLLAQGEVAAARPRFERALAIYERALGADAPEVALCLDGLAIAVDAAGEHERAVELARRAVRIAQRSFGPVHARVGDEQVALGALLRRQGRLADAEAAYGEAVFTYQRALGVEAAPVAAALLGLAGCRSDAGAADEAVPMLERALAIRAGHPGDPLPLAEVRLALAAALWDSGGDRARARALAGEAEAAYAAAGFRARAERAAATAWLQAHARR